MKKQTRNLIILGIVVVLLVGVYFGIRLWQKAKAEKAAEDAANSVVYVSQLSDVVSIAIENHEGLHHYYKDAEGSWHMEEDEAFPMDGKNLDDIAYAVMELPAIYTVELQDDLAYYGLDDGKRLTVTDSAGTTVELVLGNVTADGQSYYAMQAGGDVAYTIDDDLNRFTSKEILDMAAIREIPKLGENNVLSVTVEGKLGTLLLERGEPIEGDEDFQYAWYVTTEDQPRGLVETFNIPMNVASYSNAGKFVNAILVDDLAYINFDAAAAYLPNVESLADYGLEEPKYVITVVYETDELLEDGTYATETAVISVGSYIGVYDQNGEELAATTLQRYTMVEGDSVLYIMDEDDYEKIEVTYFEFHGYDLGDEPVGLAELEALAAAEEAITEE